MIEWCQWGVIGGVKRIGRTQKVEKWLQKWLQKVGTKLCLQKWLNKFTIIGCPAGQGMVNLFKITMLTQPGAVHVLRAIGYV